MTEYPNLKGVATGNLVEQIGTGSYRASYINWANTMQLLRDHAPGWLPELVESSAGGYVHPAPVGGFLVIRFKHVDGAKTPGVPQAIMDNRNQAIPLEKITARDITDTHRRGVCMAAALTFGLAYELWADIPLESGYASERAAPNNTSPVSQPGPPATTDSLASVIARLKELDPVTQWASVLEDDARKTYKEPGGLVSLTAEQREHMAGRLKAHADKLEAAIAANGSAGESPQKGTDGSPDSGKPEESAEGAPAESLFQAPKGARGSKAAA